MTAAQATQDENVCVAAAAAATAERAWTYISCMVAKGHSVGVAFHVRGVPTYLGVTQTRAHDPLVIAAELEECRRLGYAAGRAEGGTREVIVDRMETTFRACLDPRGYVVQRQPEAATTAQPRR